MGLLFKGDRNEPWRIQLETSSWYHTSQAEHQSSNRHSDDPFWSATEVREMVGNAMRKTIVLFGLLVLGSACSAESGESSSVETTTTTTARQGVDVWCTDGTQKHFTSLQEAVEKRCYSNDPRDPYNLNDNIPLRDPSTPVEPWYGQDVSCKLGGQPNPYIEAACRRNVNPF